MPAWRPRAQNGGVAKSRWRDDASAGCAAMLTMAADREKSRGPRRFKSQPRDYPYGARAGTGARRFSCLTPCQAAMTIALFRSCRGPSAALFTVRRIRTETIRERLSDRLL